MTFTVICTTNNACHRGALASADLASASRYMMTRSLTFFGETHHVQGSDAEPVLIEDHIVVCSGDTRLTSRIYRLV